MDAAITPEAIAALSPEQKRALLERLLKQAPPAAPPPALSITQERIWQLDQVRPGNPIYNFQSAIELEGALDLPALERALRHLVARHEVLRTAYGAEKGQPRLTVPESPPPALTPLDWSELAPTQQQARLAEEALRAAQTGFELTRPPLFRLGLIRMGAQRHVLLLTMHHLVSDLLSLDLFFSDLGRYYGAELGRGAAPAPLPASYQDFARRQRAAQAAIEAGPATAYWRGALADPPVLEWHSDYPRPERPSGAAATVHFAIAPDEVKKIEALARAERVTPFMILLSAFYILQHAVTGQDDQVVGCPTAGRGDSEFESVIGMFSYPLPMRADLGGNPPFRELLQRVRAMSLQVTEHADVPFATIVGLAQQGRSRRDPLIRSMFSYISRMKELEFPGLALRRVATDRGMSDFDLFLTLYQDRGSWIGVFEYNTELFAADTAQAWAQAYGAILRGAVEQPERPLREFSARIPARRPLQLAVAATFTADTVEDVVRLWQRELKWPARLELSPYNQVFQELLDPASALHREGNTLAALLVRPEDWVRYADPAARRDEMARATADFIDAVRRTAPRLRCPLQLYLCPASPETPDQDSIAGAEAAIAGGLAGVRGVTVIAAAEALARYRLQQVHDAQSDKIGHIPFTRDWFVAAGTELMRRAACLARPPSKVVALDCDNTLWRGVCGEDGALGVKVEEPYRALQRFMQAQAEAGMLLCLVSKNRDEDALAVFDQHPDMLLRRGQIVAHRINWLPKSENLRSLARELNLGLDSFIFIDDNPVECAEVRAACPEALTLCLPQDPAQIPAFLDGVWAFDRGAVSSEDRKRAQSYLQNRQREELRSQQGSFADFIASLDLVVEVAAAGEAGLPRLAQLSQRTNQFNNAGLRYDEAALHRAAQDGLQALSVNVRDRFGDYGLVGALFHRRDGQRLLVESFLLSCRVLGRGVEHRMVAALGRVAAEQGLSGVEILYRELPRNQPIRRFLDSLDGAFEARGEDQRYVLPAARAASTAFDPARAAPAEAVKEEAAAEQGAAAPPAQAELTRRRALAAAAEELRDLAQIVARLDGGTRRARGGGAAGAAPPQSESEKIIAEVWQQVLRIDVLGRDDNFFEVGGNSLMLVQVNGQLIERFGRDIAITTLFQFPTIASLAAHLGQPDGGGQDLQKSQDRGQQARDQMQQRMQQWNRLRRPRQAAVSLSNN